MFPVSNNDLIAFFTLDIAKNRGSSPSLCCHVTQQFQRATDYRLFDDKLHIFTFEEGSNYQGMLLRGSELDLIQQKHENLVEVFVAGSIRYTAG